MRPMSTKSVGLSLGVIILPLVIVFALVAVIASLEPKED